MFGIKTKKDKRIEHLERLLAMPTMPQQPAIIVNRHDLIPVRAQITLGDGMSVDEAKEKLALFIGEKLQDFIHFDVSDADAYGKVNLTGTIYVCKD